MGSVSKSTRALQSRAQAADNHTAAERICGVQQRPDWKAEASCKCLRTCLLLCKSTWHHNSGGSRRAMTC